ncbi:MAG: hypothetical protein HOC71_00985 [Candidatus Latescibacteria bacterium]|jgi:hypothetical protein|nr:hypothetical protein [Candidatus Latescibacterota bacterium]
MADNFDTNVAKRKPNVSKKPRPIHPWDVSNDVNEDFNEEIVSRSSDSFIDQQSKNNIPNNFDGSEQVSKNDKIRDIVKKKRTSKAKIPFKSASTVSSDLSNSINIHSNYCKLDNDVSDYLFCILSPSSQSVYMRLYRQSFGWNRNWAAESLPKLTKACNLSLQTVRKAIKELTEIGCIKKEVSDYHKATVYRVYLPSEIGIGNKTTSDNSISHNRGQTNNTLNIKAHLLSDKNSVPEISDTQNIDSSNNYGVDLNILDVKNTNIRGQDYNTQSVYFSGTTIYKLLESGGSLPKNISKYISDKQLSVAIKTIDEFYDSIGFSIVSKTLYRKSVIDYFELIKSGFSPDDIQYAVRWTFKNSRSRPENFSLIKHTMHLAMDELIRDLKNISGEKDIVQKKQETLRKNLQMEKRDDIRTVSKKDLKTWKEIGENLKESLNEHSFRTFIEPIKLVAVEDNSITLSAPQDSVSWINDHYLERIEESYREKTGKEIKITVK